MAHKHSGNMPDSCIGRRVHFGAPADVKKHGGGALHGTIIDEVWVDDQGPKELGGTWGRYCFFSQLIEWDHEGMRSIRLGYYRKRNNETFWRFAGQTTINSAPATIQKLLSDTLAKTGWYRR